MKPLNLIVAFPFMLAIAVAAHALLARTVKAVLWSWSPLASGEPEAFTYERRVYHTADPPMTQVLGAAAGAGVLLWLALWSGSGWVGLAGVLVIIGAVALDIHRWERVAASANSLWFQRGFGAHVHQVALENIEDVAVEEDEVRGFTLRHGMNNRLVRLRLQLSDRRVVGLPKTDAYSGLDAVEAVANHVRLRQQHLESRQALQRSSQQASAVAREAAERPPADEDDLQRSLRRLRKGALAPADVPPAVKPRVSR